MTNKQKLLYLEGRKARLISRDKDNKKIIHKIERQIEKLKNRE